MFVSNAYRKSCLCSRNISYRFIASFLFLHATTASHINLIARTVCYGRPLQTLNGERQTPLCFPTNTPRRPNAQAYQRNNTSTRKQTILHSPQALSHSIISLISLCICFVVKCLFLDPNWCTGINFLSLVLFLSGNILFFPVFWRILEAVVLVCKMQFGVGLCVV